MREVASATPVWIRVRGVSMLPTIPSGALVRLVPLPERPLRRGEVVLAVLPNGACVLHRVRAGRDGALTLSGDNNMAGDPPVRRADVLALADRVRLDDDHERPLRHWMVPSPSMLLRRTRWLAGRLIRALA
jgi:hypothetical protein